MLKARVNDVALVYELNGAGDPLVLIHGAQSDRSIFNGLLPVFTNQFQVLTFDQRGSGQSEKPDNAYSIAMLADDTAALMDHVGFSSAHIIGVSMGGMIAQEFALRYAQKVRSLVLGCTTPGGPKAIPLAGEGVDSAYSTKELSAEERGRALAEAAFTEGYVEAHPEIVTAMIESRRNRPIDHVGFGHRMKAAFTHDTYERLPQISCPTLVITGKQDTLIAWENSDLLTQRIPNAKSVLLEPAGHVFWIEQPQQSREAMLTFMQEHK